MFDNAFIIINIEKQKLIDKFEYAIKKFLRSFIIVIHNMNAVNN